METVSLGSQRTINFINGQKQETDALLGMAIFAGARPFSLVDDEPMQRFIKALDPQYKIPSRTTVTQSLLADCYRATREELDVILARTRYINITVDESTDIRRRRILNMSVTDGETSYHWCSKQIMGVSLSASMIADWIQEQVHSYPFPL
jgi:hypothetical protein